MSRGEVWPASGAGPVPARPPLRKEGAVRRATATIGFLADASRRRPAGRRVLWIAVSVLAIVGVTMISYPFATQVWAKRIQSGKTKQFAGDELLEAYKRKDVKASIGEGDALTRLRIPKLKISVIVVEGVSGNALRAGAGHYPTSALPGEPSNVAIAGHRTGFGQPFRHVDKLRQGDQILLETPVGRYTYRVLGPFDGHGNPWVTHPLDWSPIGATPTPMLTLTTCDPPHTSKDRLIVRAELINTEEIA